MYMSCLTRLMDRVQHAHAYSGKYSAQAGVTLMLVKASAAAVFVVKLMRMWSCQPHKSALDRASLSIASLPAGSGTWGIYMYMLVLA